MFISRQTENEGSFASLRMTPALEMHSWSRVSGTSVRIFKNSELLTRGLIQSALSVVMNFMFRCQQ
jgi:hypothetical protein